MPRYTHPLPRNKSEQFTVSMQICLLTSPAKFHTGFHLLSLICRNACPVRRDFSDLAFPQGEELIPHIDALRRILLSSPGGNRTASFPFWMMPLGCPHDGSLLFLLYPFQSSCFTGKPGMPALPCPAVGYRGYTADGIYFLFMKSQYACILYW